MKRIICILLAMLVAICNINLMAYANEDSITASISSGMVGNVFFDETSAKFSIELNNASSEEKNCIVNYSAYKIGTDMRRVSTSMYNKENSYTLFAESTVSDTISIPMDKYGLYEFEVLVSDIDGNTIQEFVIPFSNAVRNAKANETVGTGVHLIWRGDADSILYLVKNAGIGNIRDDMPWNTYEKEEGVYGLPENIEKMLTVAKKYDIDVLPILNAQSNIYDDGSTKSDFLRETEVEEYKEYLRNFLNTELIKNNVTKIEVMNEPSHLYNIVDGVAVSDDDSGIEKKAEAYARMVKATKEVVDTIEDKDYKVGILSLTGISIEGAKKFADLTFEKLSADDFDALTLHPYLSVSNLPEGVLGKQVNYYKNLANGEESGVNTGNNYDFNKTEPMWHTEFGYSSSKETNSANLSVKDEYEQAKMVVRAIDELKQNNHNDLTYIYEMSSGGTNINEPEDNFEMVRSCNSEHPYSAKFSYLAIANYNSLTANATDVSRVIDSNNKYVTKYQMSNRDTYILRTTSKYGSVLDYDFGTNNVYYYDLLGNKLKESDVKTWGYYKLSTTPFYVVVGEDIKRENPINKGSISLTSGGVDVQDLEFDEIDLSDLSVHTDFENKDVSYINDYPELGTVNNPYLIGSESDLIAFRDAVNADAMEKANESDNGIGVSTLCAKLTSDITLTPGWTGMGYRGNKQYRYGGVFDGNGHTISNMTAGRVEICGLVGESGAGLTIKNLTIEGTMEIPEGEETLYYSGGFVGRANDAVTFINCNNMVDITGTGGYLGGFIGYTGNFAHSFENCANYGNITSNGGTAAGFVYNSTLGGNATFKNCANYGSVNGVGQWAILPGIAVNGAFENCIGYGSVTNTTGPATAIYNAYEPTNSQVNSYYRSDAVTSGSNVIPNGGTSKSTEQFASGEVTYIMNGNSSENVTWGQELGVDHYPICGKVNYVVYLMDNEFYSNNSNSLGSAENPYIISSESELIKFREAVNADAIAKANESENGIGVSTLCAKLTSDITLTPGWTGMGYRGNKQYRYGGVFDGNGHTISNMTAGRVEICGLVGESGTGLTIKNLTIEGTLEVPAGAETLYYSGGFVGRANDAVTFINCNNKVNITGTGGYLGGFIGYTGNYAHSFENCANYGNITSTGGTAAGFVYNSALGGNATFKNCANYGSVNGVGQWAIIPGIAVNGAFENCIGYGSVTNTTGPATVTYNVNEATNSQVNSYYRSGVVTSGTGVTPNGGILKSTEQFASGEVTYLLNGGSSENVTWGQEIGVDTYPIYGKTDYVVYLTENGYYSNSDEKFGTADNPYLIASEADLKAFREKVHADAIAKAEATGEANVVSTLCAKLTSDITLTSAWSRMGYGTATNRYSYGGIFDGDGHTISNMTADRNDLFGFIGEAGNGLTVKNLTIEGTLGKTASIHTGGFVGRANGNVTFINCNNKVNITGTTLIGGFIGNPGEFVHIFTNCANYGNITNTNDSLVGGFIGYRGNANSIYTNCANYGSISGNGGEVIAGIAADGTFKSCIGYGDVSNANGPATATFNAWGGHKNSNCYYRTDAAASGTNITPNGGTAKTEEQFEGGEVTYLMNGSSSENVIWGQELGVDKYPIYGKIGFIVCQIENDMPTLIVALYKDNRLVDLKTENLNAKLGNEISFGYATTAYNKIQVMVWEDLENIVPVFDAYVKEYKEE